MSAKIQMGVATFITVSVTVSVSRHTKLQITTAALESQVVSIAFHLVK